MQTFNGIKRFSLACIFAISCINGLSFASTAQARAEVASQVFDKVKQNDNWKLAFLTAKDAQIVFMNISPSTNSNNEIGVETHKFDQIIFIVEGNGQTILDGKTTIVKPGDMIFIPQGVEHNVKNSSAKNPLKILSVYTSTDIPSNSAFKKKSDVPQD